jgi:hypothetical protein
VRRGIAILAVGGSLLIALAISARAAGSAAAVERAVLGARFESLVNLYANTPETVADYASASMRFQLGATRGLFSDARPLVPTGEPPFFIPWLWATPDGATIRKLQDGTFVVTSARLLGNWYTAMRCYSAGWPAYYCEDSRERLMSAPDASTIIFDEVVYSRVMPRTSVDDEPPVEVDGQMTGDLGSLGADRLFTPVEKAKLDAAQPAGDE